MRIFGMVTVVIVVVVRVMTMTMVRSYRPKQQQQQQQQERTYIASNYTRKQLIISSKYEKVWVFQCTPTVVWERMRLS